MLLMCHITNTSEFGGRNRKKKKNIFLVTTFMYISEDISAHDLPYTFLKWKPVHVGKRRIQWQKGRYMSQRFLALSVGIIPITLNFYISFIYHCQFSKLQLSK
jgi:hypothetical protein